MTLIDYRKLMGLNQQQVADQLGVGNNTVSRWERFEQMPRRRDLVKIAAWSKGAVLATDFVKITEEVRQ